MRTGHYCRNVTHHFIVFPPSVNYLRNKNRINCFSLVLVFSVNNKFQEKDLNKCGQKTSFVCVHIWFDSVWVQRGKCKPKSHILKCEGWLKCISGTLEAPDSMLSLIRGCFKSFITCQHVIWTPRCTWKWMSSGATKKCTPLLSMWYFSTFKLEWMIWKSLQR